MSMTEAEFLALPDREKDAIIGRELMGLNIVAMDWPCGRDPASGEYEARHVFWKGESPEDAKFTERGPIHLLPGADWPPERDPEDGDIVAAAIEPVPFYTTDRGAIWLMVDRLKELGWDVFSLVHKYDLWECRVGITRTIYGHASLIKPDILPNVSVELTALKAIGFIQG